MKIENSSILVTGGCGLIGSTTIDLLIRDHSPARIVILDNLVRGTQENVEQSLKDPRVELVRGDIRDINMVRRVTEGMDAVIHMATLRITACAAEPQSFGGPAGLVAHCWPSATVSRSLPNGHLRRQPGIAC